MTSTAFSLKTCSLWYLNFPYAVPCSLNHASAASQAASSMTRQPCLPHIVCAVHQLPMICVIGRVGFLFPCCRVSEAKSAYCPPLSASTKCNVAPPSRLYSAAVFSSVLRTLLDQLSCHVALIPNSSSDLGLRRTVCECLVLTFASHRRSTAAGPVGYPPSLPHAPLSLRRGIRARYRVRSLYP